MEDVVAKKVSAQSESPTRKVSEWIDEKSSVIVERPGRDASEPSTSVTWREYNAPF